MSQLNVRVDAEHRHQAEETLDLMGESLTKLIRCVPALPRGLLVPNDRKLLDHADVCAKTPRQMVGLLKVLA